MNPVVFAVDDLREQYTREMALVRQTAERTGDGTAAIRRRSAVVDRLIVEMWRRAFTGLPQQNAAVLAMGGYGRKDLFPYSDIDLFFLFADERWGHPAWHPDARAVALGAVDLVPGLHRHRRARPPGR